VNAATSGAWKIFTSSAPSSALPLDFPASWTIFEPELASSLLVAFSEPGVLVAAVGLGATREFAAAETMLPLALTAIVSVIGANVTLFWI
jgi:hypothetical protein